jgi:predicted nucleotidyltransferase
MESESNRPFVLQYSSLIESEGQKCALVGGVAVGIWTEERFTKDIDLVLAVETDNDAEKLVKGIVARGFMVEKVLEHKPTGSLAVVMLSHTGADKIEARLDLIFMQTGVEREVVENSVIFRVEGGVEFRVASVGHLIALKTLSMDDRRRPQDRLDLAKLLRVADKSDLKIAEATLTLITQRGFSQGKDLKAILRGLQETYGLKKRG